MKTIERVWLESGKPEGLKVRFLLWNWRHKYFSVEGYSDCKNFLKGKLDCGEEITYPVNSLHWGAYSEGDEGEARAV